MLFIFIGESEVARSTSEECARLKTLNDIESFVLFHLAYGYDAAQIDRKLSERFECRSVTVDATLPGIFEKLCIGGVVRDCERRRRAGKILIDAAEIEREREYRVHHKDGYAALQYA